MGPDKQKNYLIQKEMKNQLSRRRFIQAAAVSSSAVMIPAVAGAAVNLRQNMPGELPKRRLGRTDRMVSCIGFGAGSRYCNWVADERTLQKQIDYAISLGITYFDCARSYGGGSAEERFGKYLTPKYREQIFLNSKSLERTYDGVMREIEISLKTLKTDYLDLYCMHGIDKVEDLETLSGASGGYKAFLKLRDEGVAKNIGFSFHKWNDASRRAFDELDIDAVLCVINAARYNGNEDNLLPLAAQRDIGVIAIKVMGQNALIGNVSGDDLLRYVLRLPVSVADIGMDGFAPLQSCVDVAKEPLISAKEAKQVEQKLNFDPKVTKLPYYTG